MKHLELKYVFCVFGAGLKTQKTHFKKHKKHKKTQKKHTPIRTPPTSHQIVLVLTCQHRLAMRVASDKKAIFSDVILPIAAWVVSPQQPALWLSPQCRPSWPCLGLDAGSGALLARRELAQIVDTSTCRLAQVVLSALGTDTLGVSADSTT